MVLELHVWGPAFGLPSIDPECIATIAYCQRVIPKGNWKLVVDYNSTVGAAEALPILFDDEVATASGFEDIIAYLRNHPAIEHDLDANLTRQQRTDRIAFVAWLQSTATPLLDLLLYVSAENYNTATSSAYTAILPWYANYTVPSKRRELARSRTAHMGLSGLDVDTTAEEAFAPGRGTASSEYEAAKRAAGIPTESHPNPLNMGRSKGLGGIFGGAMYAARFKLDALSTELLDPLHDLLGKNDHIFRGKVPSSLDCLTFGYLSLLYYPHIPQPWLKETIQTKYPSLAAYIRKSRQDFFEDEEVNPAAVWSVPIDSTKPKSNMLLPWGSGTRTISSHAWTGMREILGNAPGVSTLAGHHMKDHSQQSGTSDDSKSELPTPLTINTLLGVVAVTTVSLVSLAVQHRRSPREGPLVFWALRPIVGLGEAGNILSALVPQTPPFARF